MKRNFYVFFIVMLLGACATTSTGPSYQSLDEKAKKSIQDAFVNSDPFDVSIGVFNPGIPTNATDYGEDGVWPELRRAEALRFAVQLRDIMTETGLYGAVRVTPDLSSSSDLYVKAKIISSNGEDISLKVTVTDSTGRVWINNKRYSHRVKPITFSNPRNKKGNKLVVGPYEPLFKKINSDIEKYLSRRIKSKEADTINVITDLRFAQNFSPEAFSDVLKNRGTKYSLNGKPSKNDPMLRRIKSIQYRDQMFIDTLQTHYDGFNASMEDSYKIWQEQSFAESKAAREAANAAFWQGVAGAVVLAATAAAAADSDSYSAARNTAVVGSAVAGSLFSGSFKSSKEAKIHRDSLNEIGSSIDGSLSPSVIEMEDTTVTLTGTASEQSSQWKAILKKIYVSENVTTREVDVLN